MDFHDLAECCVPMKCRDRAMQDPRQLQQRLRASDIGRKPSTGTAGTGDFTAIRAVIRHEKSCATPRSNHVPIRKDPDDLQFNKQKCSVQSKVVTSQNGI